MGEVNSVSKKSSHFRNQYIEYRQRNEVKTSTIGSGNNQFEQQLTSTQKAAQKELAENKQLTDKSDVASVKSELQVKSKKSKKVSNDFNIAQNNPPQTQNLSQTQNSSPAIPKSNVPMSGSAQERMMNKLKAYEPHIKAAAARYELPEALIAGIIWQESRGNPQATSHCGAMGLMQLMPGTAKQLGVTNAYDVAQNIDGGAKYIRQMIDKFGRVEHAVAAYNAGPGNVQKHGGIPPFRETRDYVPKVLGFSNNFQVAGGFPSNQSSTAMRA